MTRTGAAVHEFHRISLRRLEQPLLLVGRGEANRQVHHGSGLLRVREEAPPNPLVCSMHGSRKRCMRRRGKRGCWWRAGCGSVERVAFKTTSARRGRREADRLLGIPRESSQERRVGSREGRCEGALGWHTSKVLRCVPEAIRPGACFNAPSLRGCPFPLVLFSDGGFERSTRAAAIAQGALTRGLGVIAAKVAGKSGAVKGDLVHVPGAVLCGIQQNFLISKWAAVGQEKHEIRVPRAHVAVAAFPHQCLNATVPRVNLSRCAFVRRANLVTVHALQALLLRVFGQLGCTPRCCCWCCISSSRTRPLTKRPIHTLRRWKLIKPKRAFNFIGRWREEVWHLW